MKNHTIPKIYGAVEPTCVFVPFHQVTTHLGIKHKKFFEIHNHFEDVTREIFGPFQVVTEYKEGEADAVLECLNRNPNHLTAGIVSRDPDFLDNFLGK